MRYQSYLIEGWEYVISELYLCDCGGAGGGQAYPEARDTLLAERRVEHTFFAVLLLEA